MNALVQRLASFAGVSLICVSWTVTHLLARPGAAHGESGPQLAYSGRVRWDAASRTVTFLTSGAMPDSKEGFFWTIPAEVKRVVIGRGVTVTGGFRVSYRVEANPLTIEG